MEPSRLAQRVTRRLPVVGVVGVGAALGDHLTGGATGVLVAFGATAVGALVVVLAYELVTAGGEPR